MPVPLTELRRTFSGDAHRLDGALALMSCGYERLLVEVDAEEADMGKDWTVSAPQRFPLLRLDDEHVLVIKPSMVIDRGYGWTPIFDISHAMVEAASTKAKKEAAKKEADRIVERLRRNTERYVGEVLEALCPALLGSKRVWKDDEICAAYGGEDGVMIADAVVDYPEAFVVVEVSSRQLTRAPRCSSSPRGLERFD